jgi:hypothetical protein
VGELSIQVNNAVAAPCHHMDLHGIELILHVSMYTYIVDVDFACLLTGPYTFCSCSYELGVPNQGATGVLLLEKRTLPPKKDITGFLTMAILVMVQIVRISV